MNDLVQKLRDMSGPIRPNVVSTAADFIAKMQWRSFDEDKPENYSRVLIHRVVGQHSYVDVTNYIEEPFRDLSGVKHWMPLPEPPQ
jgi:hypothetical protein